MIADTTYAPKGKLTLVVRSPEGLAIASRRACNIVLRNGAGLIAKLFAGAPNTVAVNEVRVGFAKEAASTEVTALTPPEGNIAAADLASAVQPQDFTIITDQPGAVKVMVNAQFKPAVELAGVSEAGLMAGDVLYNQVVFEPVTLRPGQDVTFFWEIDFPFGH
ncbi:MAG: hypothetical protein V7641_2807 [Blastocatellia bacterium]